MLQKMLRKIEIFFDIKETDKPKRDCKRRNQK